jgi:hypothetical protein
MPTKRRCSARFPEEEEEEEPEEDGDVDELWSQARLHAATREAHLDSIHTIDDLHRLSAPMSPVPRAIFRRVFVAGAVTLYSPMGRITLVRSFKLHISSKKKVGFGPSFPTHESVTWSNFKLDVAGLDDGDNHPKQPEGTGKDLHDQDLHEE